MQFLCIVIFVLLSAKVQCTFYPTSNDLDQRGFSCEWSQWGYWSDCSNDCGSGIQTRLRTCDCGLLAGACEGDAEERRKCEASSGCDDSVCQFGEWSEWSACSDLCEGLRYRKQLCQCGMNVFNDSHCKGLPIEETEVCNSDAAGCCHWDWINNWSNGNSSCCPSDGTIWRRQACMCTERGLSPDNYCANRGPFKQQRKRCTHLHACHSEASTQSSCVWKEQWSEWTPCTVYRGEGMRFREKECSCGDPQLCSYPAPVDMEVCKGVEDSVVGVWVENNVTTQCDAACGVGAYWIGASCVCGDSFCEITHCLGIPHTHRQMCVGNDCPKSCEWEVNVSPCLEQREEGVDAYDRIYNQWYDDEVAYESLYTEEEGFYSLSSEVSYDSIYKDKEDVELLDKMEREFWEEKKNSMNKHKSYVQKTTRRCMCGGVESNNQYCSPALDVYEEKPCHPGEVPCHFDEWSSWSTCDEEHQSRSRNCPCPNEGSCKGSNREERPCIKQHTFESKKSSLTTLQTDTTSPSTVVVSASASYIPGLIVTMIVVVLIVLGVVAIYHIRNRTQVRRSKQNVLVY